MSLVTIVAESAAEALAEVHRRLGPDAVVVNVRKMSAPGLSRIWKKPRIELQATVPARTLSQPRKEALAELAKNVDRLKQQLAAPPAPVNRRREISDLRRSAPAAIPSRTPEPPRKPVPMPRGEEVGLSKMLENLGILPLHAQWLADQVRVAEVAPSDENLRDQFGAVQEFLLDYWNRLAAMTPESEQTTRILVGTPGVGKTTCLCKWLTQDVLLQNRTARVWRLDSDRANTAEFLSIHGEILGVPVERVRMGGSSEDVPAVQFVDLPGVQADDSSGITSLGKQIQEFKPAQVLLVLNAAYDVTHLLAHVRAFSGLQLGGLILTHMDEENRWSKFWNLLLGSKLPVLYLSGGLNIPGYFSAASPQSLFEVAVDKTLE